MDGFVARKFDLVSNFGKFLDPLADKFLISSVLIMLVYQRDASGASWAPAWVVIVIICRELIVTGIAGHGPLNRGWSWPRTVMES